MTAKEEFLKLVDKYTDGTASPKELEALDRYYLLFADEPEVTARLSEKAQAQLAQRMENGLMARVQQSELATRTVRLWPRIAAAASILLVLGAGVYFITKKSQQPLVADDVQPFTGQVILHTGHGQKLALEKIRKGTITAAVVKNTDNALSYHSTNQETIYDTLEITAGGHPQKISLADGSEVTLNVASKLRYPENFRQGASQLEVIEGEAYFDIRHDGGKPIEIKARDQVINDIGTSINVNTYRNEPEGRTTLAEGSMKVNDQLLKPGQQAVITANSLTIVKANMVQVLAWKDGYFRFNGEHIQAVMRELSRAYNIDVVYEGKPTEVGFYLRITRSRNISEVLKALEKITNTVHFKIEGRRVIVLGKKTT